MRRWAVVALCVVAVASAAAVVDPDEAVAAPWCGTTTTQDRPPVVTGRPIRVVYAYPADGPDRSGEVAPRISADVDEIDGWWQGQDPLRTPRFDRVAFPCGLQADILVVRLPDTTATLRPGAGRGDRIEGAVNVATGRSRYEKQLVYYDGPVDDSGTCGEGTGTQDGEGVALVYLGACTDVPTAVVAAHELVHALGALADTGPPNACPDTRGHPCDSPLDVLYPFAGASPLASLVLDAGHDDYYGHSGAWPDVQDSLWLRLVTQQAPLALTIRGRGSVESDVPGIDCAAACVTEWDTGSSLALQASPGGGQRFVRWTGACAGASRCEVTVQAATSVTALFAPARYALVLSVGGRGTVTGAGAPCRARRCSRSADSYTPLRLRARPATGWRLAGWDGACAGRRTTCTVPMTKATAVRARFVRL